MMQRTLLLLIVIVTAIPVYGQSVFYFPRVLATADTATGIALSNPTLDPAVITMTYYDSAGAIVGTPVTVNVGSAGQIARLSTELFTEAQNKRGWVRLSSNLADIAGFYLNGDFVTTTDGGEFAQAGNVITYPWIVQTATTSTEITITNVTTVTINPQVSLYDADGVLIRSGSVSIAGNGQWFGSVATLLQVDSIANGYLRVQSSGSMIGAEVVRENGKDFALLNARVDAPARSLVFPHVATGGGYATSIFLHNIGTQQVSANLEFFLENGSSGASSRAISVAPGQLFQGTVQSIFGLASSALQTGWVRASIPTDSLEGFQVFLAIGPGGITALPARKTPSLKLMQSHLAEQNGPVFRSTDLFTGLALLNPADVAADVTVSIIGRDGVQLTDYSVRLQPRQKQALLLREMMIEALGETSGTVWIRSTSGIHVLQVYGTWDLGLLSQIPAQSTESIQRPATPRTDLYTVAGSLSVPAGSGVSDIAVDAIGSTTIRARTDYQGRFVVKGLPAGSYIITPTQPGLFFTPQSSTVTLGGRVRGLSFAGAIGQLTPPPPVPPPANLTVTPAVVDVRVTSPAAVGAYQVSFTFNPAFVQLSAAGVTGGDAPFNATPITVNIDNNAGTVTINDFKTSPGAAGTSVVARLRFTAKAVGTSVLKVTDSLVTNAEGGTVPAGTVTLSTGQVVVQGFAQKVAGRENNSDVSSLRHCCPNEAK